MPTPPSQSFHELNASAWEAAALPEEAGGNLNERTDAEHLIISKHPLHFDISDAHGEDRVPPLCGPVDRTSRHGQATPQEFLEVEPEPLPNLRAGPSPVPSGGSGSNAREATHVEHELVSTLVGDESFPSVLAVASNVESFPQFSFM